MTTHDDSNSRGHMPNPRHRHEATWDSDAALTADGYWCVRCRHHRVQGVYGDTALCPSCLGDDKDAA